MGSTCGLLRRCCGYEELDDSPSQRRPSLIDRRGSADSNKPSARNRRGSHSMSGSPTRRSSFDALSAVLWRGGSQLRTLRVKASRNVANWEGQWTVPSSLFGRQCTIFPNIIPDALIRTTTYSICKGYFFGRKEADATRAGSASDDCCRAVAEHLRPHPLADGEVFPPPRAPLRPPFPSTALPPRDNHSPSPPPLINFCL